VLCASLGLARICCSFVDSLKIVRNRTPPRPLWSWMFIYRWILFFFTKSSNQLNFLFQFGPKIKKYEPRHCIICNNCITKSPFTVTCYHLPRPRVRHEHCFSATFVSLTSPQGPSWTLLQCNICISYLAPGSVMSIASVQHLYLIIGPICSYKKAFLTKKIEEKKIPNFFAKNFCTNLFLYICILFRSYIGSYIEFKKKKHQKCFPRKIIFNFAPDQFLKKFVFIYTWRSYIGML
jgi:hypothetical protein